MLPKAKSCRILGPIYQSFIINYDGFAYYKLRDEVLLQFITNYEKVLTNCDRYSCIILEDNITTDYVGTDVLYLFYYILEAGYFL